MKTFHKLIIFVKNPIENKVKTRLAHSIGSKKALDVYKKLLLKTYRETVSINIEKFVFYDETIIEKDIWDNNSYSKRLQKGDDLGERMENAFKSCLDGHSEKVVIIGSDCYDISKSIIEKSFESLEQADIVIGPSEDGGYYLLGMKELHHFLFEDMPWSESNLLDKTLQKIHFSKKSVKLLETLNDIDTVEDLKRSKLNY